ncbi:MAG: dipeptide epimerase [Planctomycetota bacterium]
MNSIGVICEICGKNKAMLQLTLHPVELPLRHAWTIAHGTRTVQRNLIVALHDPETGHTGYGEAPGIPYMGVTVESMCETHKKYSLEALFGKEFWERFEGVITYVLRDMEHHPHSLAIYDSDLQPISASDHFFSCAVDEAINDLFGKRNELSLMKSWGEGLDGSLSSNYTLGMDTPEVMVAKLREYPDFPSYKVKLGRPEAEGGLEEDLAVLRRLREETDAVFRVDANTGWDAEQTIRASGPLRDLGVEFIEQPLPPDAPRSEYEAVYFGSDLPIIADESCQTEEDVEKCAGLFHGINIKLCKCGGMTPARRMIAKARELDLKVMMGCMTETTVGISALAQFLPLLDYVDMDGAMLLADGTDPADGVKLAPDGVAIFPEGEAAHGNGVTLTRELPAVTP